MMYILHVSCSRDGISRDGGEHDRGEYPSDTVAIRELTKSARELLFHYDRVAVTIEKDNKAIYGETLHR